MTPRCCWGFCPCAFLSGWVLGLVALALVFGAWLGWRCRLVACLGRCGLRGARFLVRWFGLSLAPVGLPLPLVGWPRVWCVFPCAFVRRCRQPLARCGWCRCPWFASGVGVTVGSPPFFVWTSPYNSKTRPETGIMTKILCIRGCRFPFRCGTYSCQCCECSAAFHFH